MDFKNSQAKQGRAFRHLWQMKKFGKICLLFGSVQPISLNTLGCYHMEIIDETHHIAFVCKMIWHCLSSIEYWSVNSLNAYASVYINSYYSYLIKVVMGRVRMCKKGFSMTIN